MIPVDMHSASSAVVPSAPANMAAIDSWSASPSGPVAAFAEPLVEMTPCAQA
jgi:hypothetical protein